MIKLKLPALEWILPPRFRKRKEIPPTELQRLFARLTPDDPAFQAIAELGRNTVLDYLNLATTETLDEKLRLTYNDRAMTLANFLNAIDVERSRAGGTAAKLAQENQTRR